MMIRTFSRHRRFASSSSPSSCLKQLFQSKSLVSPKQNLDPNSAEAAPLRTQDPMNRRHSSTEVGRDYELKVIHFLMNGHQNSSSCSSFLHSTLVRSLSASGTFPSTSESTSSSSPSWFSLEHCGRVGDGGVDFHGHWHILQPGIPSTRVDIPVVGQCKFQRKRRLSVGIIRDFQGVLSRQHMTLREKDCSQQPPQLNQNHHQHHHHQQHQSTNTSVVGILVSSMNLTKPARDLFMTNEYPMMFCWYVPLAYLPKTHSGAAGNGLDDGGGIDGGELRGFLMNDCLLSRPLT